jgi:hypothetical protein
MKLIDSAKKNLCDDLIHDPAIAGMPDADEIVRLVQRAKMDRLRRSACRRAVVTSLVAGCVLAVTTLLLLERRITGMADDNPRIALQTETAMTLPAAAQQPVQRLDDEELLELLDSTPSALVEWPDGRQALLLVVAPASGPN